MHRLAGQQEYLDGPLAQDVLIGNLRDLARVNRWLGGVALSRRALVTLVTRYRAQGPAGLIGWRRRPITLLDVGTGAADIPAALLAWTGRRDRQLQIEAVDQRAEILDIASNRVGTRDDLHLALTRGDQLPYDAGAFDIAHISLVLHHLEPGAATLLLEEMARVSTLGVIVNDLDRSRFLWMGAWLMSHLFTRNRYTRHDAPLSVRRAYRPSEVAQMASTVGLVEVARIKGLLGHRYASAFVHVSSG